MTQKEQTPREMNDKEMYNNILNTSLDNNNELEKINNKAFENKSNNDDNITERHNTNLSAHESGHQRRISVTFGQSADDASFHKPKLQRTPTPFHEIWLSQSESTLTSQDGDCVDTDDNDNKDNMDDDFVGVDDGDKNDGENKRDDDYDGISMKTSLESERRK